MTKTRVNIALNWETQKWRPMQNSDFYSEIKNQRFLSLQESDDTTCLQCHSFLQTRGFGGWEMLLGCRKGVLLWGEFFATGTNIRASLLVAFPSPPETKTQSTYTLWAWTWAKKKTLSMRLTRQTSSTCSNAFLEQSMSEGGLTVPLILTPFRLLLRAGDLWCSRRFGRSSCTIQRHINKKSFNACREPSPIAKRTYHHHVSFAFLSFSPYHLGRQGNLDLHHNEPCAPLLPPPLARQNPSS